MQINGKMAVGILLGIVVIGIFVVFIVASIQSNYQYNKKYMSYWNLADKTSTIGAKADYINQFVAALQNGRDEFADNDAVWLKTNDNSFDYNLMALETLRDRLQIISTMNESDLAYQVAIQQITAQEQGEAQSMLGVFEGAWYLKSYPFLWRWMLGLMCLFMTILIIVACIFLYTGYDDMW